MTDYSAEIAALYAALANDTLRVKVGDKDTTFHTAEEIEKRIAILTRAQAASGVTGLRRYGATVAAFGDD
ncbi:hypothetical protein [Brevundimonas mediterranea]|jgi:hypothetical protein|uniref:Uncharacterized protein n=1 Tax=Brevundimonas mediterranea TaxID=74329 RepID=A0A7Z8Y6G4_9CAUL|nr:hypothetical protein [Brevundimonas mediterranea]VDC51431.1 hypothetical protein BREV_BREV_00500 [Brevundimonas mediterranea]